MTIHYDDGRVMSHEQAAFIRFFLSAFPFFEVGGIVGPGEMQYVGESQCSFCVPLYPRWTLAFGGDLPAAAGTGVTL